jgi:hypothetical protein
MKNMEKTLSRILFTILQLKARVINKPDMNQVYGIPMTLTREMWFDHTSSTLDTQQSNPS